MTIAYKVELFFNLGATGGSFFTLNDAVKGKLDDVTYLLAGDATDVAPTVLSFTTRRGRSRQKDVIPPGAATVVFSNETAAYDPVNTSSPYNGNIKPGKRIRFSAAGVPIWDGYIDDWNLDYNLPARYSTATANAFDALAQVGSKELVAQTMSAQGSGARVAVVLSLAEVVFPEGLRSIDTGTATLQGDTVAVGTNALQYLQTVAQTEQGYLFGTTTGVMKFQGRGTALNRTAAVTFSTTGIPFDDISIEYGSELLYNRVSINRVGGTAQIVSNTTSQAAYGIRTLTNASLLYDSDAQSLDTANWLLNKYDDPEYRIAQLSVQLEQRSSTEIATVLALDLSDVVTITFTPPGASAVTRTATIESITHNVVADLTHRVTFTFGDFDSRAFLVLDDAVLGKLDSNLIGF